MVWPVAEATELPVASPAAPAAPAAGAGHTVLVIDDEPAVASAVAGLLGEYAYDCVIAQGGLDGIRQFLTRPDDVACVVLDLTMPAPGGREVLRVLRERRPTLPVVLVSGYAQEDVRAALGEAHTRFLRKPFLGDDLARAVGALVPAPRAAARPA